MNKILYYTGLICFAFYLFTVHAKFLHYLDPGKESELFILFGINFKTFLPYIWGAAFGVITTILIALIDKREKYFWLFVFAVAFAELIGVMLYNNTEIKDHELKIFASIYYGLYVFLIVIMYAFISYKKEKENFLIRSEFAQSEKENFHAKKGENDQKVINLLETGNSPKQIAEDLGINLSTVYRIKKRNDGETTETNRGN